RRRPRRSPRRRGRASRPKAYSWRANTRRPRGSPSRSRDRGLLADLDQTVEHLQHRRPKTIRDRPELLSDEPVVDRPGGIVCRCALLLPAPARSADVFGRAAGGLGGLGGPGGPGGLGGLGGPGGLGGLGGLGGPGGP